MGKDPELTIRPIGVVHCGLSSPADAPMNYTESSETGTLEIFTPYTDAMEGLEAGKTIVVLFWLHKARRDLLKVYPRGDRSRGLRGIFTTRSPMRPNPIALSEFTIQEIRGNSILVSGIDVIDGTPILDIKSTVMRINAANR
ncbi:MAG: tRNA (N6-threonylcarbamoyladenosine(37)-N6)-methyltransferase TrmO [Desulfobulbaceae bacterium]|nr:tRNA (N6-threonylcarbamoyladenosine(37)-N6)-methyltransferase TrmO [Desulfobulbaceae bacterium]